MYNLEEFPPQRRQPTVEAARSRPIRTRGAVWPHLLWFMTVVAIAAGGYLWMHRRVEVTERELTTALNDLDEARNSLRLLWTVTARLDAAQVERQDVLENSIDTVKVFVESEVSKLWQAAYLDHSQRIDQNSNGLAAAQNAIRQLRDADGRTNTRVDALVRQSVSLEAELRNVESLATEMRTTLASLSDEIQRLDGQLSEWQNLRLALDNRLRPVEQWVEGYRSEGLSARAVQSRFASLVQDLQRMNTRVDSLRQAREQAMRTGQRPGSGN